MRSFWYFVYVFWNLVCNKNQAQKNHMFWTWQFRQLSIVINYIYYHNNVTILFLPQKSWVLGVLVSNYIVNLEQLPQIWLYPAFSLFYGYYVSRNLTTCWFTCIWVHKNTSSMFSNSCNLWFKNLLCTQITAKHNAHCQFLKLRSTFIQS